MFSLSSLILSDFDFKKIEIEVSLTKGLPYFEIIGLPGKIVKESCFRIKEGILKTLSDFPEKKIIVNLSPSDIPKNTKYLDLAIALNIMIQFKLDKMKDELNFSKETFLQKIRELLKNILIIGELGLDGKIKADENIISYLINSYNYGFKYIFTSEMIRENIIFYSRNKSFIKSEILFFENLKTFNELISKIIFKLNKNEKIENIYDFWLKEKGILIKNLWDHDNENNNINKKGLENISKEGKETKDNNINSLSFQDYIGNHNIKYGLLISLCGFHNVYLRGPTGTGKTMLSKIFLNYLPELTEEEKIELAELFSKFDLLKEENAIIKRPVRSPHHSITNISMLGGGNVLSPGEVTLAHRGVLILDEVNLYKKDVIESLREPINDNCVSISRVNCKIRLPSMFLLFMISNLCPCGASGSKRKTCICSKSEIINFNKKISQAIIDRIDINLIPSEIEFKDISFETNEEKNYWDDKNVRNIIKNTVERQKMRYKSNLNYFNGKVDSKTFFQNVKLEKEIEKYLKEKLINSGLSFRQYEKIIRISRTIADIKNSEKINESHIDLAMNYIINSSIYYENFKVRT